MLKSITSILALALLPALSYALNILIHLNFIIFFLVSLLQIN
jgi:hypothetical protein